MLLQAHGISRSFNKEAEGDLDKEKTAFVLNDLIVEDVVISSYRVNRPVLVRPYLVSPARM